MKKLLSVFAAAAMLFGFASCSGDLHDYEYNETCIGLYLAGDIQADADNRGKLTYVNETTQTYEFTYDSSTHTYWGGSKGTINFKLCTDATSWKQDFGGKMDIPVFLTMNEDFTTLEPRNAANSNPGNIKVENLVDGKTYKITVNYDAGNLVAKVKIEGEAIDFPTLRVVTKAGDSIDMVREGTSYKYVFTPEADGSIEYYVTNGYLFYSAEDTIEGDVPVPAETVKPTWTKFVYTAGTEYLLEVKTAYDKNADVTFYAGVNDTTILAKADIIGSINGWSGEKLTKVDDTTYTYDFTATGTSAEFSIREKAGSWDSRWCGNLGSADANGVWDKSNFITLESGDKKSMTYVVGGDPAHVKLTLLKDSKYRLIFTITGDKAVSAELKLVEKVEVKVIDLTGFELAGDPAWVDDNTATGANLVKKW